jgi:hypothetical protein
MHLRPMGALGTLWVKLNFPAFRPDAFLTLYLGTGCRLFFDRRSDYECQAKDRNLQRRMLSL